MEVWLEENNRYLAASLHWLRLKLQQLAPGEPPAATGEGFTQLENEKRQATPGRFRSWFGSSPETVKETPLLTAGSPPPLDDQILAAGIEREEAARIDPPPALIMLAQRLGLSTIERDTLLLCAAMEFDPGLASLCARAQNSQGRNYPTLGLALSTFDDPSWDALSPHRPLRYARLIEINQPGATPLTSSPLRADERIVNFLKGLNALDDRLATLVDPVSAGRGPDLAESQQLVVDQILRRLHDAVADSVLPVVQLVGADIGSRLAVAGGVSAALNRRLYRLSAEALPTQLAELETFARLWQRESFLLPVALYIDAANLDSSTAELSEAFRRFLSRELGLVFLGLRETPARLSSPNLIVDVNKPTASEQAAAWSSFLGNSETDPELSETSQLLAGQFNLSLGDLREAASIALKAESGTLRENAWKTCRDLTRPSLDLLAQRLDPKATWDDLVLSEEQMRILRQIADQVRERHRVYQEWGFAEKMNRGFGVSALFTGESGVGKTMAAEVIANELQLNLYRIDLSSVVSKYIGETEKNLRKLFDAAEKGGAILLFDEADALFGKRSEVKDSHDRYANIEINYLLQRMESFSGLAILATNMKSALDAAFMRRLRFIVNFQFPGLRERRLIWERALPVQTPKEALDYDRLARLNITGGNIHSIALNAAFMAARAGGPVTMPILLSAARSELRKLERPFSEAEFR